MKTVLAALVLALTAAVATAAPDTPVRDLGHGLGYIRVHSLPADLPPPGTAKRGAFVLDLRYARGDDDSAAALGLWLRSHCTAATPVFVLANAETSRAALAYLADHEASAGLLTLGAPSSGFAPDIPLKVSADTERKAYDAADQGTPLETLLTDNSAKPRHDEASIAQDQKASLEDPAASDTDLTDPVEPPPAAHVTPPPLLDLVLLRAVHLHHALLALKKL